MATSGTMSTNLDENRSWQMADEEEGKGKEMRTDGECNTSSLAIATDHEGGLTWVSHPNG